MEQKVELRNATNVIRDTSDYKDAVILGEVGSFEGTVHLVHGKSDGSIEVNLDAIGKLKSGDMVMGDLNNDLTHLNKKGELDYLQALKDWLDKNDLYMEMSQECIDQIMPYFKARSKNSLFSQQLLKNGLPTVYVKDLPPCLVFDNKKDEHGNRPHPTVPVEFENHIRNLSQRMTAFKVELKKMKKNLKSYDDPAFNELCKKNGIINYHNVEQSSANDHPFHYYDDKKSNTVFTFQNSIEQADYVVSKHFNPQKVNVDDPKQFAEVLHKFDQLDEVVYREFYSLRFPAEEKEAYSSSFDEIQEKIQGQQELDKLAKLTIGPDIVLMSKLSEKGGVAEENKIYVTETGSYSIAVSKDLVCKGELGAELMAKYLNDYRNKYLKANKKADTRTDKEIFEQDILKDPQLKVDLIENAASHGYTKSCAELIKPIVKFYEAVLKSEQFRNIVDILALKKDGTPAFDMSPEGIEANIKMLTTEVNLTRLLKPSTGIYDPINAIYQGLDPDRPQPGAPVVAMNGNGFPPLMRAGKVLRKEEATAVQVEGLERNLAMLKEKFPGAKINFSFIEARDKKGKEQEKCSLFKNLVEAVKVIVERLLSPRGNGVFGASAEKANKAAVAAPETALTFN